MGPSPRAHGRVDVPAEELVHGFVPGAPVGAEGLAVPPLVVKRPVRKPRHLGQGIEERLEERKEPSQPDDQRDGGQLEQPLQDRRVIQRSNLVERVAQDRRRILRAGEPDEDAEANDLADALGYKDPPDLVVARVRGLVDEGGGPPEVDEVVEGDVARVWAFLVDFREGVDFVLDGVEVGVAEVAVREGVRSGLEPDDDGVQLGEGADERVVDVVVDDVGGEGEGCGDIDGVGDPDELPGC